MTTTRLTRRESAALTRARLVKAAAEVFAEKGFFGASVEGIAERAGFTRGAFYRNFADKSEIFLAVFDERASAQVAEVARIMVETSTASDLFERLRERGAGRPEEASWLMLTTEFWLYAMRHPEVRPKLAARRRAIRRQFERAISSQFSALGLEPPAPIHDLAVILQVLDEGIGPYQSIDPGGVRASFFVDALAFLFEASVTLSQARAQAQRRSDD